VPKKYKKYSVESKDKAYRLYHKGRYTPKGHVYSQGDLSLKEISEMTGVSIDMVSLIGKGMR
jgi:hypothetical protein